MLSFLSMTIDTDIDQVFQNPGGSGSKIDET